MANTASLVDTVRQGTGVSALGPVYEYEIAIDTVDTDLTIRTPDSNARLFVVGAYFLPTESTTLTFKSGNASKTKPLALSGNQAWYHELKPSWIFCTKRGEALTVQASAALTGLTLYLVEVGDY